MKNEHSDFMNNVTAMEKTIRRQAIVSFKKNVGFQYDEHIAMQFIPWISSSPVQFSTQKIFQEWEMK
jgi:hypothetical protein